jgi:hypothetical protein
MTPDDPDDPDKPDPAKAKGDGSQAGSQAMTPPAAGNVPQVVIPPAPPGVQGATQLTVALGMQLMGQGQGGWANLPDDLKREIIMLTDRMDERQFKHAQGYLENESKENERDTKDHAVGRREILVLTGLLAALGLAVGTFITIKLIDVNKPELAYTVMMSGLSIVTALLGGAGLSSLLRKFMGRHSNESSE